MLLLELLSIISMKMEYHVLSQLNWEMKEVTDFYFQNRKMLSLLQ